MCLIQRSIHEEFVEEVVETGDAFRAEAVAVVGHIKLELRIRLNIYEEVCVGSFAVFTVVSKAERFRHVAPVAVVRNRIGHFRRPVGNEPDINACSIHGVAVVSHAVVLVNLEEVKNLVGEVKIFNWAARIDEANVSVGVGTDNETIDGVFVNLVSLVEEASRERLREVSIVEQANTNAAVDDNMDGVAFRIVIERKLFVNSIVGLPFKFIVDFLTAGSIGSCAIPPVIESECVDILYVVVRRKMAGRLDITNMVCRTNIITICICTTWRGKG